MRRSFSTVALLALVLSIHGQQAPQFTISTVAGNGTRGFSGDAGPATGASLNNPYGVALDASGMYIADTANNRIRKVASGTITTVAGTGAAGFGGDGGPATRAFLNDPLRVSLDAAGTSTSRKTSIIASAR